MSYRLVNYLTLDNAPRAGVLVNDIVTDLKSGIDALKTKAGADGFDGTSTISAIQAWDKAEPLIAEVAAAASKVATTFARSEIKFAAPLLYPNNIFCAAANYRDHFREMSNADVDKSKIKPYFFNKVARQTVIGSGEQIRKPKVCQKLDWEAEIVAVIGKRGRNIKAANALDHVMGYTIINDLSARDFIQRPDWPLIRSDWLWQKSFDTSAPMGPWITPRSEVPDPQNLKIDTWVNERHEQNTHSREMVFTVAEQIEALSEHFTLLPGDVIATGTGSGVGHPKGRYLNPGDMVRIEIEKLGELRNPVIAGE